MLRALHRYQKERRVFGKETGNYVPVSRLVRDFTPWSSKRSGPCTSLDDRIPWMPFEAIYRLSELLTPQSRVFEWGVGGSTLFLLDHAGEVISVEHDQGWFDSVYDKLSQNAQWSGILSVPVCASAQSVSGGECDPTDPSLYGSSNADFLNHRFDEYAQLIDSHDDESFDVVIVDGRSRPSCAMHARSKVAVGGVVVIDNAERPQYHRIHEMYSDRQQWEYIDCSGPSPYHSFFNGNAMYRKLRTLDVE